MSSGLEFPAGSMLWVFRAPGFDEHGDPILDDNAPPGAEIVDGYRRSHQIGPCAVSKTWAGRKVDDQERLTNRISVTCTDVNADVTSADRIELPDGRIVDVTSTPTAPTNPWTGWSPGLRFTLEEVT